MGSNHGRALNANLLRSPGIYRIQTIKHNGHFCLTMSKNFVFSGGRIIHPAGLFWVIQNFYPVAAVFPVFAGPLTLHLGLLAAGLH